MGWGQGSCFLKAAARAVSHGLRARTEAWQVLALLLCAPALHGVPLCPLSSTANTLQAPKFRSLRRGRCAPDMKGISGHLGKQ